MRPSFDRPARPFRPRCLILGMVLAWIVALYVPAFLLAATGVVGSGNPLAAMWALTDRVALAAKLALSLAVTLCLLATRPLALPPAIRLAADVALGAFAMILVLAFLPETWSGGLGIGLTGERFDADTILSYLAGGALAGLVFSIADRKCGPVAGPPA